MVPNLFNPNRTSLPHESPYNPFHIDHTVDQEGREPLKCHEIVENPYGLPVDPHSIEALRIRLGSQKGY